MTSNIKEGDFSVVPSVKRNRPSRISEDDFEDIPAITIRTPINLSNAEPLVKRTKETQDIQAKINCLGLPVTIAPANSPDIEVVTISEEDTDGNESSSGLQKAEGEEGVQASKLVKCKKCDYSATTKHDLWDHKRCHIRPERMLRCHKCNFVTEYRHHLKYHLLNHTGSKPFKCDSCSYTCVYKPMLSSHMKSHGHIRQHRLVHA